MNSSGLGYTNDPSIYKIRLIGPWDVQWSADGFAESSVASPWKRVQLPATWSELFGNAHGTASFRRTFHAPSGLDEGDRVWIELPPDAGALLEATLNGKPVARSTVGTTVRLDITHLLEDFNTLLLTLLRKETAVQASESPGGLWKPVLLAIESSGESARLDK